MIGEAQQLVGICHIQIVTHQRHAKGRVQVLDKHGAGFGDAIVVRVAQQGNPVCTWHSGPGAGHDLVCDPALDALAVIRFGRRVGFGYQHIAIGQHIEPARVVEVLGEGGYLQARSGGGCGAIGPADRRGDIDGGDQGLVGFGQFRRWAGAIRHLQGRTLTAGSQPDRKYDDNSVLGLEHMNLHEVLVLSVIEKRSGLKVQYERS